MNSGERNARRTVELMRLRRERDQAATLREQAEWSVAIEETMGGRPPTRAGGPDEAEEPHRRCGLDTRSGDAAARGAIWNGGPEPDVTWGDGGIDALNWADGEREWEKDTRMNSKHAAVV
jgi:hypothetical protein